MKTELNANELSQVTGGLLVANNIDKGARRVGKEWGDGATQAFGGGPVARFFGSAVGLGGATLGGFLGFTHTLGFNPMPK